MFAVYGAVYLAALGNYIDEVVEDALYSYMDVSVKLLHSIVFTAMHRTTEVDLFFSSLRSYLDILVGMRALVGAQFDLVINCQITSCGLVVSSTSMMVEERVGKPLINKPLGDICAREGDRQRLSNLGIGNFRSGGTSSSPWERQEAVTQIADMVRIDLAWVESPTGSLPAEVFRAGSGENRNGDIILIGVKLLQADMFGQMDEQGSDTASEISEYIKHMPLSAATPAPEAVKYEPKAPATSVEPQRRDSLIVQPPDAPRLTDSLIAQQNKELEAAEEKTVPKRTLSASPSALRHASHVPSSRRSVRSFDQRSVCSGPLSPVEEELTDQSSTEGSLKSKHQDNHHQPLAAAMMKALKKVPVGMPKPAEEPKVKEVIHHVLSPASSIADGSLANNNGSGISADDKQSSCGDSSFGGDQALSMNQFRRQQSSEAGDDQSEAASLMTYRTTLGESKNVQATVNFISGSGQMNSMNFTLPSSCSKYQKQVEQEHSLWDWERLVVNQDELETHCRLGVGTFAMVHKVTWRGHDYALKSFNTQAWTMRRRGFPYAVRREVSILAHLASLGHPHLCRLTGIVIDPKIALLFEFCEGGTLWHCLLAVEPFSWDQRLQLLSQIVEALLHLHEQQVMHRDLKDNNVLFLATVTPESKPHVKVADVGLARWLIDADDEIQEEDMGQTPTAPCKMTPLPGAVDWHAPEIATGFYGISVDIFAFGVLFLEVVAWQERLPVPWRRMLSSLHKPDESAPLPIIDVLASCVSSPAERPSAAALLKVMSSLNVADAQAFSQKWKKLTPTPTNYSPYVEKLDDSPTSISREMLAQQSSPTFNT
jgi:serine/threonine protein kinase